MFINSKKHTREACTHTFFFFFWIVTCSNMKKADCFFLPQPASFTTRGFLGLGAGAAPNKQRRSNAVAFRLAAGMLLMFLSCSLPLDFCGGGCIRVSLMASFSPVLARPLAKGLLLSRWLGWRCGRKRSVSVQSRCAVAWLFGVTKSAPAGAGCRHCAQRCCRPQVVLACNCLHKKCFPVHILRYRLPSLALSPSLSLEWHPLLISVAF